MRLGEICNREVVVVGRDAPVREAVGLMREHHVGDVVVVEEREGRRVPVGILTDRDVVVGVIAEDAPLDKLNVGDIMSFEVITARDDACILDTVKLMRERGVRRLPVVDGAGGLVGILSVDDLLEVIAEQISDLVHLVANEQTRERRSRT